MMSYDVHDDDASMYLTWWLGLKNATYDARWVRT